MDRGFSRGGGAAASADARWHAGRSQKVIGAGLVLTTAMVVAQLGSQLIDFLYFDLNLRALDSNHHRSVFGAASLLAQAAAAGAIALRIASSPRRLQWLSIAGLVSVLLLVRALVRPPMVVLLLPAAAIFVSLCWLTMRDETGIRATVWAALLLLACSFALHVVGPQAHGTDRAAHDHTWAFQLTGMLKHSAELAGWMLLATGMAAAALSTYAGRRGTVRLWERRP